MLKLIGVVAVVLAVSLVLFVRSRPDRFRVERTALVHAPADVAFAMINDFHQWGRWSPYEKLDPNMTRSIEGPPSGPGATYSWSGNSKAGAGKMTILESRPGELVSIRFDFYKPFAATNHGTFKLVATEQGTQVTWAVEGENTTMGKVISAFLDMDKLLGANFEEGLANLDAAVRPAKAQAPQAAPALAL